MNTREQSVGAISRLNRRGTGNEVVQKQSRETAKEILPLALTALLLLFPAVTTPLMSFEVGGLSRTFVLLDGLSDLRSDGLYLIAVLLGWCALGATFCKNGMLMVLSVFRNMRQSRKIALRKSLRLVAIWETHEVLALGVIICILNLSPIGSTKPSAGLYLLAALFATSMLATSRHEKGLLRAEGRVRIETTNHSSLNKVWALVLTGFLFYIPANLYPVATFTLNGVAETRTILGSVSKILEDGKTILAVIVFMASVAIPLLKLTGLAVLLVSVQGNWVRARTLRIKMYKFIRVIGRWALLDIFIIMILISVVDFGLLATVRPESAGIYSFCIMVIITLLAAESFDPRLLRKLRDD